MLEATMEEWLKMKEAAKYLKVHHKTLYRYVKSGKIRQYQPGGVGRPRFRREDLDVLLHGGGISPSEAKLISGVQGSNEEVAEGQQAQVGSNPAEEDRTKPDVRSSEGESPLKELAVAGMFGTPESLGQKSDNQQSLTFAEEVAAVVAQANLPFSKRRLAQRLIMEAARTICTFIKKEESER